jgi:pimeloyl-ACP methyl ester carboxylesterase
MRDEFQESSVIAGMLPPSSGDRPAVVLLHSSGSTPRQWRDLVEILRRDFRVLGVEFYGHGLRDDWAHERRMTLADEAKLTETLMHLTGGAHLVGHSYGGAVALKLASMYPDLVRSVVAYEPVLLRLVVEDTAHPQPGQEVLRMARAMRERLADGEAGLAARGFVEFWSGPGAWQQMPSHAQQSLQVRMPSVMRHFDAVFAEPFVREQMAHLPMPLLFLTGGRTVPVALRIAQLLRASLPLAEHEELPGMGHMGPITHAKTVNERVRQFLHAASRAAVRRSSAA